MKARHTTATTTSSNSEYNYQNILNSIIENDPSFVYLDLSKLHLTGEQLREIASKIQNNNFVGHIDWGTVPHASEELVQKIESKIILNNQNYKHHPNDFVHGLFSLHAYIDSKENDIVKFTASERNDEQIKVRNEQLADWKVHKVFNEPKAGRYYAVTYINEQTKQMVLTHRGTIFEKLDLLKTNSPLKAHFKSVLGGQIVVSKQQHMKLQKRLPNMLKIIIIIYLLPVIR